MFLMKASVYHLENMFFYIKIAIIDYRIAYKLY